MRDQRLTVEVEGGELRIRIGIDALKFATEGCQGLVQYRDTGDFHHPKVTDAEVWAHEIRCALEHESIYTDSTPVQELLDKAMADAVENGANGISLPDDDDYEPYSPWA